MSPQTAEHKAKISIALKGKKKPPFSDQHKKNISLAKKGKKLTEEHKKHIKEKTKNRVFSDEHKANLSLAQRGKPKPHQSGSKHPFWKGGITPINRKIRNSLEYKLWRGAVFARDDYTCVWCGARGVKINADHIKPFAYYPELRLAIDNGRTLCVGCHKKTDTWGSTMNVC